MARTVKKKNNKTTEVLASQIISCKDLARQMVLDNKNGQRFCFILGSGASIESGIPTGYKLELAWMNYLMGREKDIFDQIEGSGYGERADQLLIDHTEDETRELTRRMSEDKRLKHPFSDIEAAWQEALDEKKTGPWKYNFSEYYFDIYRLRFSTDETSGYRYLEQIMEKCKPSIGYHTLAHLLTKSNQNNLVISTNFDSLVEDALFLYTDKKPLVVNHESLAKFIDPNIQRPMVAKVHRGLFYDPMNSPDLKLSDGWKKELEHLFAMYTPIVIGYGGGDHSLMDYLEKNVPRRIYWSFLGGIDGVPDRIKKMVTKSPCGRFVSIKGFDSMMLELGKALFGPEALTPTMVMQHFDNHMKEFIKNWGELEKRKDLEEELKEILQCEAEMKKKRKTEKQLTAWDHFQMAMEHENNNPQKAVKEYSSAIELKPDYAEAYNRRGFAYNDLGEHLKAIADYDKAIALKPDYAEAYNNRGYEYSDLGEHLKAIAEFNKAIALKPDYAEAYSNRGCEYSDLGEHLKAIADFNKAIALKPDYAEAYSNRGCEYSDLGEHLKAIADFNKAIALKPDFAECYNNRGQMFEDLGEHEKAIADYNRAIALKPNYAGAYNNRGYAYNELGEHHKAIADYDRAIALKTNYAGAYNNRGYAYNELGEHHKAIADYDRAIELKPGYANPHRHLGNIFAGQGNMEKALEELTMAISLNADYLEAYEDRAKVNDAMGQKEHAEADRAKAEELRKKNKPQKTP